MASGRGAQPQVFHLWPEHVAAFELFQAAQTQWRYDQGFPTGLDYGGVRATPYFHRLAAGRGEAVMDDMCVIERAWLAESRRLYEERRQD